MQVDALIRMCGAVRSRPRPQSRVRRFVLVEDIAGEEEEIYILGPRQDLL